MGKNFTKQIPEAQALNCKIDQTSCYANIPTYRTFDETDGNIIYQL